MKRILPITLIVLGTIALSGCFFIPTFNPVISGRNVAKDVGDANSKRALRVGSATMQKVIALLGYPLWASDDGKRIAYTWVVRNGNWVYPFCFTAQEQRGERALELIFDANDELVDYQVIKVDRTPGLLPVALTYSPVVPPGLKPTLRRDRYPYIFPRPATQPATKEAWHDADH